MTRFTGVGVLITGSSRGLGRALAAAFAKEGAHVGITYRVQSEGANETLGVVRAAGGTGTIYQVDVRQSESVKAVVAAFEERAPIGVLVNNAAIVRDKPFLMVSRDEWVDAVATNLNGTYHACRAVVPMMMARRRGAIINISSVAAVRASPGQSSYASSKAAVLGLTITMAKELAPYGVRVNAIVPGLLNTGMGARLDRQRAEERRAGIPLGRFGEGSEVARAALFLASDDASYVVGQALTVDGGLSL